MTEYDKKDRPNMSKGGAHPLRQQWLKDSDLAHESTMRYYKDHYWAHTVYWRVKPEALETSKAARAPETIPTSHQRSWSGRRS